MTADTGSLRRLWQEAFGDSEETVDAFFATGFSSDRCNFLSKDGIPVSALYWFDCTLQGQKLAYLYGVATAESYRGQGFAHQLMADTHEILKTKGYAGAILVPGESSLFAFYEKMGYRTVSTVTEFSCTWGSTPAQLQQVDAARFAELRNAYLPEGGVVQGEETLNFLQTQAHFYTGKDFLLAASVDGDTLLAQELLGNPQVAPGLLQALNIPNGRFRTPGAGRKFAMFLPLQENCPVPAYFGLALD